MGRRDLRIIHIRAQSLSKKSSTSKMQVYAKAYLSYKPKLEQFTSKDPEGDVNPRWMDHSFRFILKSRKISNEFLNIVLYDVRPTSDKEADPVLVGHVQIPLEMFQDENKKGTSPRKLSQSIPGGGTILFSYILGKYNNRLKALAPKADSKKIVLAAAGIVADVVVDVVSSLCLG